MTSLASNVTFRILLVEDDEYTREFLNDLITETLDPVYIDAVDNVGDALQLISRRRQEGMPYHLALLDFKLPPTKGMQHEIDVRVCQELKTAKVPIIHFTGYADDPAIRQHMATVHPNEELAGVPVSLIEKTASGKWVNDVIDLMVPYHHKVISKSVRERVDVVFGKGAADADHGPHARFHESALADRIGCGTCALLDLYDAIVNNWSILEPGLQKEIRERFAVCELEGEEKRLSFFPLEDE